MSVSEGVNYTRKCLDSHDLSKIIYEKTNILCLFIYDISQFLSLILLVIWGAVWYGMVLQLVLLASLLAGRIAKSPLTPWSRTTVNPEHQDPEALDGKINAVYMVFI